MGKDPLDVLEKTNCPVCDEPLNDPVAIYSIREALKGTIAKTCINWQENAVYPLDCGHKVKMERDAEPTDGGFTYRLVPVLFGVATWSHRTMTTSPASSMT